MLIRSLNACLADRSIVERALTASVILLAVFVFGFAYILSNGEIMNRPPRPQDLGIGEFGRRNPDDFNRPCLQQRSLPGVSAIVNSVWMRQVWSRSLASHPNRFLIIWRWWEMRQTAILGLAGWGAKSSAAVLAKFVHLESIPKDCREWRVNAANASALADTLCCDWDNAILFPKLATLRTDIELFDDVDQLRWNGATPAFESMAARLDAASTETRRQVARRSRSTPKLQSAAGR